MSLDIGDLVEGLFNLLDIGPIKYNRQWPFWRRCLWFVWRLAWTALVVVLVVALIIALVTWLTGE